jgi:hypothetical protein
METKTHIDKLRNPNYLGGWDLLDEHGKTIDKVVTIKEIKNESVFNQKNQEEQQVITVFFNECKPIILNATNRKTLKKVTDTEYIEDMIGKRITLTTKKIKAFGEMHDAIRIVASKTNEPVVVDVTLTIAKFKDVKTLDQLKTVWGSLSTPEQANAEVIAKKDALKTELTK